MIYARGKKYIHLPLGYLWATAPVLLPPRTAQRRWHMGSVACAAQARTSPYALYGPMLQTACTAPYAPVCVLRPSLAGRCSTARGDTPAQPRMPCPHPPPSGSPSARGLGLAGQHFGSVSDSSRPTGRGRVRSVGTDTACVHSFFLAYNYASFSQSKPSYIYHGKQL